jgi:hypothetical protein
MSSGARVVGPRGREQQQPTPKPSTGRHLFERPSSSRHRRVPAGDSASSTTSTLPRARAALRRLHPTRSAPPVDARPCQILRPPQILAARLRGGGISAGENGQI